MTRLRALTLAASLAAAWPALAQQLVGHVPLLPARAGYNPIDLSILAVDPTTSDVFALNGLGLTVLDRAADTFANVLLAPSDPGVFRWGAMVFDPVLRRLYVGDWKTNDLVVVDGATRAVIARVPLPVFPGVLAFDPVRKRLYVGGSSGVAVVDSGSLALLRAITLAGEPRGITVMPTTGRVYVAVISKNTLYVLEPDLTLRKAIALNGADRPVVADASTGAGGRIYLTSTLGVAVVDGASETVSRIVTVSDARMVEVNPLTGFAYALWNRGAGPLMPAQLVAIDPGGGSSTLDIGGNPPVSEPTAMAIDPAGGRLFVADTVRQNWTSGFRSQGRITVFDIRAAVPVRVGDGFAGTSGDYLAFHPGTGRLYVTDPPHLTVHEVDPTSLTTTRIVIGAAPVGGAMNDPGGISLTLDTAAGDAALVDVRDPARPATRTRVGEGPLLAAVAEAVPPNGEFYVVNEGSRSISVLDATTGALLRTRSGLGNQATIDFALDRNFAGGTAPQGFLTSTTLDLQPDPASLQSYQPAAGDLLTDVNGGCGACLHLPLAVDEGRHRLYAWTESYAPAASRSIAVFDTATGTFLKHISYDNPNTFLFNFTLALDGLGHVFFPEYTPMFKGRVVMVTDAPAPTPSVDILTRDQPSAITVRGNILYLAEPGAGLIGIADTSLNPPAVVAALATGGYPVALLKQPGNSILWVAKAGGYGNVPPPSVEAWNILTGQREAVFDDLQYGFNFERALVGQANGRVAFADFRHGSVAVLDPNLAPAPDLQIEASSPPDGVPGEVYPGFTLSATGALGPLTWEVTSGGTGAAPFEPAPGLVLDPSTGTIAGTPTTPGAYSFMVRVRDDGLNPGVDPPRYDMQEMQVRVLDLLLITSSLPAATCGSPYDVRLLAAGGTPPYTFGAAQIPAWATLDPLTGRITGTPSAPEACPVVDNAFLVVSDGRGAMRPVSLCLAVVTGPPPPALGNQLRAARQGADVVLSVSSAPPAGGGFNIYRSEVAADAGTLQGSAPTTITTTYTDTGVTGDGKTYFYRWRAIDACGGEGP